eukprot:COSAG02_NODE_13058_length_1451_cov_20.090976_1_plen_90_part_00
MCSWVSTTNGEYLITAFVSICSSLIVVISSVRLAPGRFWPVNGSSSPGNLASIVAASVSVALIPSFAATLLKHDQLRLEEFNSLFADSI